MSDPLRNDYAPYDKKTGRCRLCRHPAHPRFFTHKTAADLAAENEQCFQTWMNRQSAWIEQNGGGEEAWQKLKEEANAGKPLYIVRDGVAYLFTAVPPTCDAADETWDGCIASAWALDRLLLIGPAYRRDEHLAARKARRAAEREPAAPKRR